MGKRSYIIKKVNGDFSWENIEKAPIDIYRWEDGGYEPECFGQLVLFEEKEIRVKLTACEKEPYGRFTKLGDYAWLDSCIEFFVAFNNKTPDRYANFEFNSLGAAYMQIGHNYGDRENVFDLLGHVPYYKPEILEDRWVVEFRISLEDIKKLFGEEAEIKSGYKFTANLLKCGEEAEIVHYGMWNESISEEPQFHKPKYFGNMIIE